MGLIISAIRNLAFLGGLGLLYWGLSGIDPRWAKVAVGIILLVLGVLSSRGRAQKPVDPRSHL
jgi:hypothetical protein